MKLRHTRSLALITVFLCATLSISALADPWPAYQRDASRNPVTSEKISPQLHRKWVHISQHAPRPAWPEPGRELNRLAFDYAYQIASDHGLVYFGSSADHTVYALDLQTGEEQWHYITGGPIRFAPTVSGDRLFVASDDGHLYCLAAKTGELQWSKRLAPENEKLIGNGQLISRWPLRSGVAVDDGVVFSAAGMWPAEGVYIYALDATDGSVVWHNDTAGRLYLTQPHPPSVGFTGVAAQGPLVLTDERLFVPTGRNVPAVFDRDTGELLYYRSRPNTWGDRWGGTRAFTANGLLFNWRCHVGPDINVRLGESDPWEDDGMVLFDNETGKVKLDLPGKLLAAVNNGTMYAWGSGKIGAYDLNKLIAGKKLGETAAWETELPRTYSLIAAGDTIVAGGDGTVTTLSADTGAILDQASLVGQVRGLAAADGNLLATTSDGCITCFSAPTDAPPRNIVPQEQVWPYDSKGAAQRTAALADRILAESNIKSGYALLPVGDPALAYELARRSDLTVICTSPDPAAAQLARRKLHAAGAYGTDVVVHHGTVIGQDYPDYFANLIVLLPRALESMDLYTGSRLYDLLRPCGGVALLPVPTGAIGPSLAEVHDAVSQVAAPNDTVRKTDSSIQLVRGPLPGAGQWTHEYADAARSGASEDQRVRLPLKLLWFGRPGPAIMVSRHWQGPAPLSIHGKLFVIGQFSIHALDAYNGHELWRHKLDSSVRYPTGGKGSSVAIDDDSVYVVEGDRCMRLGAANGHVVATYTLPEPPQQLAEELGDAPKWAYLAVTNGIVLGSMGSETEGRAVFAIDKASGDTLWTKPLDEVVSNNAFAVGDGLVFILDRTRAAEIQKANKRGDDIDIKSTIRAFDLQTGDIAWQADNGFEACTELWLKDGVLVATGGGKMHAWAAADGDKLWGRDAKMARFPVFVGDTIYGEPRAYDLHTGETVTRTHPLTGKQEPWVFRRSYGCGSISAAPNMLMFRSGVMGFYDLSGDTGVHNFGGIRAGCHVNMIAANGLVAAPPADAGCTCSYNFQTTVAMQPSDRAEAWGVANASKIEPGTRIKHAALNFGAPGDKRDSGDVLWLGVPRNNGVNVPIEIALGDGAEYYRTDADLTRVYRTSKQWLYTSGIEGPAKITLQVGSEGEATYTVKLFFADLEDRGEGERVFDVKVQDQLVCDDLDLAKESGLQPSAVVKTFTGVSAPKTLTIELIPQGSAAPLISALQITRE